MIENLKDEIWMVHPKYDWLQASNYGRIKSIERDIVYSNGAIHHQEEQLINPSPTKDEYLHFHISNKKLGINDCPFAHRFVYEAFNQMIIPKGNKEIEINHLDCNRSNNQISNLELLDHQSNVEYSQAKAVGQYTLDGNLVKKWQSMHQAEREGGYQSSAVCKCCNNKFHREGNNIYKGFKWQYIDE